MWLLAVTKQTCTGAHVITRQVRACEQRKVITSVLKLWAHKFPVLSVCFVVIKFIAVRPRHATVWCWRTYLLFCCILYLFEGSHKRVPAFNFDNGAVKRQHFYERPQPIKRRQSVFWWRALELPLNFLEIILFVPCHDCLFACLPI